MTLGTGPVSGVASRVFPGFNASPVAQREMVERRKNGSRRGRGGQEEAVSTVDQARPKCRGCLAGTAQLGSFHRFTDMTSVAPVQFFLW